MLRAESHGWCGPSEADVRATRAIGLVSSSFGLRQRSPLAGRVRTTARCPAGPVNAADYVSGLLGTLGRYPEAARPVCRADALARSIGGRNSSTWFTDRRSRSISGADLCDYAPDTQRPCERGRERAAPCERGARECSSTNSGARARLPACSPILVVAARLPSCAKGSNPPGLLPTRTFPCADRISWQAPPSAGRTDHRGGTARQATQHLQTAHSADTRPGRSLHSGEGESAPPARRQPGFERARTATRRIVAVTQIANSRRGQGRAPRRARCRLPFGESFGWCTKTTAAAPDDRLLARWRLAGAGPAQGKVPGQGLTASEASAADWRWRVSEMRRGPCEPGPAAADEFTFRICMAKREIASRAAGTPPVRKWRHATKHASGARVAGRLSRAEAGGFQRSS